MLKTYLHFFFLKVQRLLYLSNLLIVKKNKQLPLKFIKKTFFYVQVGKPVPLLTNCVLLYTLYLLQCVYVLCYAIKFPRVRMWNV